MISAIELEKCVANAGIYSIVVGKLCNGKKPCSMVMLQVDKNSEIGFHCTILPLSLAIYL